ncbi:MAG: NAD-dependent deacylase [Mycobacteriaceae bacterium]|uniref:NAD-dependent deacylase n=1 Tax=Corynebacterium sp. TaxID=1720 RepID=UPI003F9B6076
MSDLPEALITSVRDARRVEVFTGAGMSADSGLDTFRDATTGLWTHVDPQAMASVDSWARDPDPMWAWYLWRAAKARTADPNPGHTAVAAWQHATPDTSVHVTTQNIDDLHERAGSSSVSHLHGNLFDFRCTVCGAPAFEPDLPEEPVERLHPPECSACGNLVRPGVVWFGEALPQRDFAEAEQSMQDCDLVVIVGTSGVVYPAAGLPQIAAARGVPVIEISPDDTDLTPTATWSLRTTAAQGLPALLDVLS